MGTNICSGVRFLVIAHCSLQQLAADKEEEFLAACSEFTAVGELCGEPGSGEVFLDLTRLAEPSLALRQLEEQVVPYLGQQLFSSLAKNKLVARAATLGQMKKLWIHKKSPLVIRPQSSAEFLAPLPVEYLWLAELSIIRQLKMLGIWTIGQLAAISAQELKHSFGAAGLDLAAWSRGQDSERVKDQLPSFISQRLNWPKDGLVERQNNILTVTAQNLAAAQARQQKWGRRLEIRWSVEGTEQKIRREIQFPRLLVAELRFLLQQLLCPVVGETVVDIRLGPLTPLKPEQLGLFDGRRPQVDRRRLSVVIERLKERYPGQIHLGLRGLVSRREKMLAFYDPLCRRSR